jgi:hypothetical protein
LGRDRELVLAKEGQLVPIPALKNDFIVDDVKEAATPKSERVAPFEDGPLAVFKNVLHEATHFGRFERVGEHGQNRLAADNRRIGHLMVDGLVGIERSETNGVGSIEGFDPSSNEFFGCHEQRLSSRFARGKPKPQRESRRKNRAPKKFLEAYPEAAFEVVNRDNYAEFIGIELFSKNLDGSRTR